MRKKKLINLLRNGVLLIHIIFVCYIIVGNTFVVYLFYTFKLCFKLIIIEHININIRRN